MVLLNKRHMIRPVYGRGFLDKVKKVISQPHKILLGSAQKIAKPLLGYAKNVINALPINEITGKLINKIPESKIISEITGLQKEPISNFISDNSKKLLHGLINIGENKLNSLGDNNLLGNGLKKKRIGKGLKIL